MRRMTLTGLMQMKGGGGVPAEPWSSAAHPEGSPYLSITLQFEFSLFMCPQLH